MDLKHLDNTELINTFAGIIKQLKSRGVIRTKDLIDDFGECLAIEYFNKSHRMPMLQAAPSGTLNINAISRNGDRYCIKSNSGCLYLTFFGLDSPDSTDEGKQRFEYILIADFDEDYQLDRIIQINWNLFDKYKCWHETLNAWTLTLSNALVAEGKVIYQNNCVKSMSSGSKRKWSYHTAKPWTKEEDTKLKELFRQRKSTYEMSKEIGRSIDAICSRIKKLELSPK